MDLGLSSDQPIVPLIVTNLTVTRLMPPWRPARHRAKPCAKNACHLGAAARRCDRRGMQGVGRTGGPHSHVLQRQETELANRGQRRLNARYTPSIKAAALALRGLSPRFE